jgi:hypothetical protein
MVQAKCRSSAPTWSVAGYVDWCEATFDAPPIFWPALTGSCDCSRVRARRFEVLHQAGSKTPPNIVKSVQSPEFTRGLPLVCQETAFSR